MLTSLKLSFICPDVTLLDQTQLINEPLWQQ